MEKVFSFKADAKLEAESLSDAFRKIGMYYLYLALGVDASTPLISETQVEIKPVED